MISLVGLPGSGKSTVGRQLARRLRLRFLDCDRVIEQQLGCSIREYFEREGEEQFRDIEEALIDQLTQNDNLVLATGGGAILRANSRARLRERTYAVYLNSQPEELFRRLRYDVKRPLLQVTDPMARLRELHAQRDPLYRETAKLVVDTGRPSVATLVSTIVVELELAGGLPSC